MVGSDVCGYAGDTNVYVCQYMSGETLLTILSAFYVHVGLH